MTKPLKPDHYRRIDILCAKQRFDKLDALLQKLAGKDFDVAGVPFQLLDRIIATGVDPLTAHPLAQHTVGGQPRLFAAILHDLADRHGEGLRQIITDTDAHPMTRFEAMGWSVYLAHRANMPVVAPPAGDIFQFWDHPIPPLEVQAAQQLWEYDAISYVSYDDAAAKEYVCHAFGQDAANDYDALWHPALKSDVFRLYRLAQDGGLYADADSHPGAGLANFATHAGGQVWASAMTQVPNCVVVNGFLAAPAQNPFILDMLDEVLRNIKNRRSRAIFWLSGPGAFTDFLYRHKGRFDVGLLPQDVLKSDLFRQFDAPYKKTALNWRVYEHARGLNDDDDLARITACL